MDDTLKQDVLDTDQEAIIITDLHEDDCNHMSVMGITSTNLPEAQMTLTSSADVHPVCQLDMDEYVSVEVFDANEIEINTDDNGVEDIILPGIHNHRDLPYAFNIKDEVPDTIAADTVITTSHPRRRKQKQTILQHHETRVVSDDICVADSSDGVTLWAAAIQTDALYLGNPCTSSERNAAQIVEVLTTGDVHNFVTLNAPDDDNKDLTLPITITDITCNSNNNNVQEASIREITKREKDRVKKQAMRADPEYRMVEKEKSCARMRLKRSEITYRDKERVKDRVRRRLSRQKNDELRQRERDRDRHYKKAQRFPRAANPQDDTASYSIDLVDMNGVDL